VLHSGTKPYLPVDHFAKFTELIDINKMPLLIKHLIIWIGLVILPHPFYLSVTELKYNASKKSMEVSCKMFTNDLEDALKKTSGKSIDLLNTSNKKEAESVLFAYIQKRFIISVNNKPMELKYIGYEKEEEAIWTYMEIVNCEKPNAISIDNKLLYDYLKDQMNIVHCETGSFKESSKVVNPDSKITFTIN
jgi:SpoU rRNA methylase family enzyme